MSDETTSERATCATCRFYGEEGLESGDPYGACRRRAPAPGLDASTAHWPAVALSDWCGEHAPKGERGDLLARSGKALGECRAELATLRQKTDADATEMMADTLRFLRRADNRAAKLQARVAELEAQRPVWVGPLVDDLCDVLGVDDADPAQLVELVRQAKADADACEAARRQADEWAEKCRRAEVTS